MKKTKILYATTICLVAILCTIGYSLVTSGPAFAVLTTPPPEIPGPYYVSAEAMIYGSPVDLNAIKTSTGGEYSTDYTYVQWGDNPLYRMYVDNTLQQVYSGSLEDVIYSFCETGNNIQLLLETTFDDLKSSGVMDPNSIISQINYFGNIPGEILWYRSTDYDTVNHYDYFNVSGSNLFGYVFAKGELSNENWESLFKISLNDTILDQMIPSPSVPQVIFDFSGISAEFYRFELYIYQAYDGSQSCAFYFDQITNIDKQITPISYDHEGYLGVSEVIDSPGTNFVSKVISPASPVAGSTIQVKTIFNPPSAVDLDLTDLFLNTFTYASVDVLLEKFTVSDGLVDSVNVHVVPVAEGDNMKISVAHGQAPSILSDLQNEAYVCLTYRLVVPESSGEYTLPAANMTYLIPTPE